MFRPLDGGAMSIGVVIEASGVVLAAIDDKARFETLSTLKITVSGVVIDATTYYTTHFEVNESVAAEEDTPVEPMSPLFFDTVGRVP